MELPVVVLALAVDAITTSTRDRTEWITGSLWSCGKSCGAINPRDRPCKAGRGFARHTRKCGGSNGKCVGQACNLLVKMTSPRWGKKRSAQRIVANAKFYHVAARGTH
jgi:hypothetical protein